MERVEYQQLQLSFDVLIQPMIESVTDPCWDEVENSGITSDTVNRPLFAQVESEILARSGVDKRVAPQQNTLIREQLSFDVLELNNTVRAQVSSDTAPEHNYPESSVNSDTFKPYTHWGEKYWVKRRGEKHEYYRYCWMEGRKKYRCHISGRAGSISANHRKEVVCEAINDGQSPQQIKQLIRALNN